jgi:hypothetical protein
MEIKLKDEEVLLKDSAEKTDAFLKELEKESKKV